MTAFPGPTPAYTNPPIQPQFYQPSRFIVTSITLGADTLVTTSVNHNYVIGQLTRLLVPQPYGTYQLNEQSAYVIAIPAPNQVLLNINSSLYNAFVSSPAYSPTTPQILAIGDINTPIPNAFGLSNLQTTIPGAFIDIS